jgi:Fic family protein
MLTANNRRPRVVWDELEAGLGSGAQFRILLHLAIHPEEAFTKYALDKATGLRTPTVTKQLERLSKLGWVKKHESSPVTYQVCLENEVVRLIYELFCRLKGVKI